MGGEAIKVIDRFSELIIDAPIGAGMLTYFMINAASDIGGVYKQMVSTGSYTPAAKASIATAGTSTGAIVGVFATNSGAPNIAFIPDGVFHLHVHALKGAAGAATLYGEIYKRDAGGIETLLWTTAASPSLTTIEIEYDLVANTIVGADVAVTDRLVIKFKVIVASGTPDITLYFDGIGVDQTNSRTEMPTAAIDDNLLVHKAGVETITGIKTFTASPIVPAGATGTQVPQMQEVQSLIAASGGGAVILYPDATVIIPAGAGPQTIPVYTLSETPSTVTETIISGAATAGVPALIGTFLDGVVGSTVIPAGEWDYPLYRYVDSQPGVTSIAACVYLNKQQTGATIAITGAGTSRTATVTAGTPFVASDYNADATLTSYIQTPNGQFKIIGYTSSSVVTVETLSTYTNETGVTFTLDRHVLMADSGEINDTSLTLQNFSITIPAPGISCGITDRVCVRFHAVSTGSHTVYIYYGSQNNHYSHIHTTISQDISQNMYAAPAVTTFQDADRLGFWNSLTSTIAHITPANIWTWITTKMSGIGLSVIVKFLTYIDFPYAGQIYQYTTGGALIRGYTDIEVNMNGAKTITAASWAAGFITYTVTGHELSNPVTTDRITAVCSPAGYSLTKGTPVWIDANNYKVAAADPGAAFVSGTSYTLNLYEKFETVNAAVSTTTGIWANRDTAALCKFTGYTEGGIDKWFQDNTTTVGTVPAWGNAKMILDAVNGRLAVGAIGMPPTSIYTNTGYFASTLQCIGAFYHNTHINTQNKAGSGFLQWVTRTTTGAETALQLAYIELINFVSVTLPAIVAGRLEWDGTDLWFSESATVRSPINNTKYLINAQVGTTYTFVLADKGYLVSFANAAAITATVPPNSSVAFPIGTIIRVVQDGAGKLTIAAGVGVTINSLAGNKAMAGQYSDAWLVKEATDTWYLFGNLIA